MPVLYLQYLSIDDTPWLFGWYEADRGRVRCIAVCVSEADCSWLRRDHDAGDVEIGEILRLPRDAGGGSGTRLVHLLHLRK